MQRDRSIESTAVAAVATALALGLAVGVATVPTSTSAATPAPVPANPDPLVERGRYLADAAHCAACHTVPGHPDFAGNLALNSPFGVMYSSNITSDPDHGIGRWTEAQFEAALRKGRGAHGEYLYPSMPYLEFTKISDDDVHALWAYVRTIPPVAEATRANRMKFPFDIRLGIGAWQALYFKPGRYVADASQSADWNRGAYLVQGLGHCAACHTPTNFALAPRSDRPLRGNVIDHWYAPDISAGPYSGIRDWSEQQVVAYLAHGHNDKNVAAVGPMYDAISGGLGRLTEADLKAIAVYLKNQDAGGDAKPPVAQAVPEDRLAAGAHVYADNCASCHGSDGRGRYGIAPALAGNSAIAGADATNAIRSVLQGYAPQDKWGVMPSFGDVLDAQDIADVVNYARTSWGNAGGPVVGPWAVERLARSVPFENPAVDAAVICPSAPAEQLDPATLQAVAAVSQHPSAQTTRQLVTGFHARHPALAKGDVVTVLAGAYCRDVMAMSRLPAATRQASYVAFIGELAGAADKLR